MQMLIHGSHRKKKRTNLSGTESQRARKYEVAPPYKSKGRERH